MYNGVRAANLSTICCLPKLKQQSRKTMSKLIQGVLLRGKHNRVYHYDFRQKFPGKTYQQSIELPVDWLTYYDSLSRVSRSPTELYSFKLFSVPYLILRDRTKRESHYYNFFRLFNGKTNILSLCVCILDGLFFCCCDSLHVQFFKIKATIAKMDLLNKHSQHFRIQH